MLDALMAAAAIGVLFWIAWRFGGCPVCRGREQAGRTCEDDGIHIRCADCGHVEVIPWEDLH